MSQVINVDVFPDLSADSNAFSTFKLPTPVKFRIAEVLEIIPTNENDVPARPGDAVMVAESGKTWPIPAEDFWSTYDDNGDGTASKKKIDVFALELESPVEVAVSWTNALIKGNAGDFLIQGGVGNYWIVERQEFYNTYAITEKAA